MEVKEILWLSSIGIKYKNLSSDFRPRSVKGSSKTWKSIDRIPITLQTIMTRIKDIIAVFEGMTPFNSQEDYDNSGLIIGDPEKEVSKILLCIDSTEAVIQEAKENSCELILAHHPIVFKGLKRFNSRQFIINSDAYFL